jgi:predicted nucleic acid-binding protein
VILVDSSVWIQFFRGGDAALVAKLGQLLDEDQVAVAPPIRLEILGGASRRDLPRLRRVLSALPLLEPGASIWDDIERWVELAVARGQRFGVGDLLIAGIAAQHAAEIWSLDHDFARMERLGFVERHR